MPRTRHVIVSLLILALVACGSNPSRTCRTQQASAANAVLFQAIGLVGTPYRYGGNTPAGGFDCSGLVGYVFHQAAGINLPRTTKQLSSLNKPKIARSKLTSGDLVFFGKRSVTHIGIYVGEGRFVHAPSSGGTVRLDTLDGPYWKDHYLYARRVLD